MRDARPGPRQHGERTVEGVAYSRIHSVEHDVARDAEPRPFSSAATGSAGASPASTASITAQHATLGASGPTESKLGASGSTPVIGTRRAVGL